MPLSCQPPQTPSEPPSSSIKHSFLLSNCCPLNLLGRDLMIVFGIHLKSTPDGVVVTSTEPHQYSLLQTDPPLIYVYQWWVNSDTARKMTAKAREVMHTSVDFMSPEGLHCTAHVFPQPDSPYADAFLACINDSLRTSTIYWSSTRCAISTDLTPDQLAFYTIPHSHPHISLAKEKSDRWRDLGPWVNSCSQATDWTPHPGGAKDLPSLCVSFLALSHLSPQLSQCHGQALYYPEPSHAPPAS